VKSLRPIIRALAFILGVYALVGLLLNLAVAFSHSGSRVLLFLSPLLIGILLGLISARSFVSRQWQKGPALALGAATFTQLL
jgi:uncharacterized membrane protein